MDSRAVVDAIQPGEQSGGRRDRLATIGGFCAFSAVLLLVLLTFYWPFFANRASFYILDFPSIWHPLLSYVGERFGHLQLPLWNPYVLNGIPQAFSPAINYPPYLLYAVLPFSSAAAAVAVVQQVIAGAGMFLVVQAFGLGLLPAAFAGFAYSLGGWMFSTQSNCVLQGPAAWFPLTFWCVGRIDAAGARAKLLFCAAAAVSCWLLVVSGLPEVFGPAYALLITYCLVSFLRRKGRHDKSVFCLRLSAMLLGLLLSAPFILPQAEWAALSLRAYGLGLNEIMQHSASWYDFACLALPQPLGDLHSYSPFFNVIAAFSEQQPQSYLPYLASPFLGAIPLTLAVWASFDRTWVWRWTALALMVAAALASLGWHTPLVPWAVAALHVTSLRFPIKLFVWVVLPVVLLAARGLWMLGRGVGSRGVEAALFAWLLLLAVGAAVAANHDALQGAIGILKLNQALPETAQAVRAIARATVSTSLVGLLAELAMILRLTVLRKHAGGLCLLVLLAAVCSLMINAWQFMFHPGPIDFYSTPIVMCQQMQSLLPAAQDHRMPRVCVLEQPPELPPWVKLYPEWVVNYKAYYRQMMVRMTGIEKHVDDVNSPMSGQTADNGYLWSEALIRHADGDDRPLSSVCKVYAVDFVCAPLKQQGGVGADYKLDSRLFRLVGKNAYLNYALYAVAGGLPRAYLASNIKWGTPHKAVVKMVAHPQAVNFDAARFTVLERRGDAQRFPLIDSVRAGDGSATIVLDEPEHVAVDVCAVRGDFLVLADQFYPGWQALVDGKTQPIIAANGVTRAVWVDRGEHRVDFFFKPLSFYSGIWLAGLAFLLLAFMILLALLLPGSAVAKDSYAQG